MRDHLTCYYCGLHDDKVEAGGVWFCPNKFCQGPGGFYGRTVAGYHGEDGLLSPEQEARMIADCSVAIEQSREPGMKAALLVSLKKMVERRGGIQSKRVKCDDHDHDCPYLLAQTERMIEALKIARGYVAATEASITTQPNIVTHDRELIDTALALAQGRSK